MAAHSLDRCPASGPLVSGPPFNRPSTHCLPARKLSMRSPAEPTTKRARLARAACAYNASSMRCSPVSRTESASPIA